MIEGSSKCVAIKDRLRRPVTIVTKQTKDDPVIQRRVGKAFMTLINL